METKWFIPVTASLFIGERGCGKINRTLTIKQKETVHGQSTKQDCSNY